LAATGTVRRRPGARTGPLGVGASFALSGTLKSFCAFRSSCTLFCPFQGRPLSPALRASGPFCSFSPMGGDTPYRLRGNQREVTIMNIGHLALRAGLIMLVVNLSIELGRTGLETRWLVWVGIMATWLIHASLCESLYRLSGLKAPVFTIAISPTVVCRSTIVVSPTPSWAS
jgi:hypothetical protein